MKNPVSHSTACWGGSVTMNATKSHGTSVASVAGGNTLGVARGITIVDARAFSCGGIGTSADIVAVLEWIPEDENLDLETESAVVNLSFATPSEAHCRWSCIAGPINRAVGDLVNQGIMVVAAAGNHSDSTFNWDPASSASAITVAGTDEAADIRSSFSNWGYNTDIYAPAQNVESAGTWLAGYYRSLFFNCFNGSVWPSTGDCVSGTSFSAPLVAGVVARYLENNHGAARAAVMSFLTSESHVSVDGKPLLNMSDCY